MKPREGKIPNTLGGNYKINVKSRVYVIYDPMPYKITEPDYDEEAEEYVPEEIDENDQKLMKGINDAYNEQLSEIANKGYTIRVKEIMHSVKDGVVKVYLEWEEIQFEDEE